MKFCRLRVGRTITPAAEIDGQFYNLSNLVSDIGASEIESGALTDLVEEDIKLLPRINSHGGYAPCVAAPSKIVCIGLNYRKHALEAKLPIPEEPIVFLKAPTALSGANDAIPLSTHNAKLDWEVELALIIGKRTKDVRSNTALESVFGYSVFNDVSDRAWQFESNGQWTKGKSHDGYAPLGPFLVTSDEVVDPHGLDLNLSVNHAARQSGSTSDLIFDIPEIVSYVSKYMTLLPGDVIATGTPPGVGMGHEPQVFLKEGDIVVATISGLGTQVQKVRSMN